MKKQTSLPILEFIILMALLTALGAMATDAMLPALSKMGYDLGINSANDVQFIIYTIFAGFGLGQIFYGPLSDSIGRKKSIYISLTIFILGSIISMVTNDFTTMLIGRFLQGFGASGPKIVTMALIRDEYKGRKMAKIMSFISVVFVLVPAIAPIIGGFILQYGSWHHIFLMFIISAIISLIWFGLRQKETLSIENRKPFALKTMINDSLSVIRNRQTLLYIIAIGVIFGVFVSYLSTAEQIFAQQYNLKEDFPLYFAINAVAFGVASLLNAKIVENFGMRYLSIRANIFLLIISTIFVFITLSTNGHPSLFVFMLFCMLCFFCIGILFGNLNALAMEPMGAIAGTAAAVIGSVSMIIALPIGVTIGLFYNNSVSPLIIGFSLASIIVFFIFRNQKNS